MGVKSTIIVDKATAMAEMLDSASNGALADVLEILNDDARDRGDEYGLGLANFYITDQTQP